MRILFLCHKMPYPLADGGCIASFNMMQGMVENGAEVHALCMTTPKHNSMIESMPAEIQELITWHSVFVDTAIKPIKALKNILFSSLPYNAERFVTTGYQEKLQALLATNTYDVIQLEGLYLTPYIAQIREHSNAKLVMRSHNLEHQIWQRMVAEEGNLLKRKYKQIISLRVRRMELDTLSSVDALIPISKVDAVFFKEHYYGPIMVSPTGMPPEKFDYTPSLLANFFHIGALDWEPNRSGLLWFLNEVWSKFSEKNPKVHFVLAGRNAPAEFIKQLTFNCVDYEGEVPDAKTFIQSQGVMVVPLFSGSGMRIKIIEGMALGKCIITTPIGAEGIPVENQRHIIICSNVQEMLNGIDDLLQHPEKVTEIGKNAFQFAKKHYDNTSLTKELLQFYCQNFS